MQSTPLPPVAPALPFFVWAIPPECQWWDIATREPHPQVARELLRALAAPRAEGAA